MNVIYVATPFFAWLVTGSIKFAINSIKAKQAAFDQIGYGSFPSNHTAISSSIAFQILLIEGLSSPALGVAVAFTFIVILDANSLRNNIARQAKAINEIQQKLDRDSPALRERIGHSKIEILGGLGTGFLSAWLLNLVLLSH